MIQPILSAIDAWLAIYTYLPWAIRALMALSAFFLFISKIVHISFGSKGD